MDIRSVAIAALLTLFAALASHAQAPAPQGSAPQGLAPYVTARDLDLSLLISPPPLSGSSVEKAEIEDIIDIQRTVSADRMKIAVDDNVNTVFAMFGSLLGPNFVPSKLPKTVALFDRAFASETFVVGSAKAKFNRARPYAVSKQISTHVPAPASASYPSGHASRVTVAAVILGAILPELSHSIWARAEQYAESRIVVGVHYASDVDAGRSAGTALGAVLFARPDFRADLAAAKLEVRAALGAKP